MKIFIFFLMLGILSANTASAREVWAPENGYCSVNQRYAYNKFRFDVEDDVFPKTQLTNLKLKSII